MVPIDKGMGDAELDFSTETLSEDITSYIASAISWHDLEPTVPPNIVRYSFESLPNGLEDGDEIQFVYWDGSVRWFSYISYIRYDDENNDWYARGEWHDEGVGLDIYEGLKAYARPL